MGLKRIAEIELPEHVGSGGFDHADIHRDQGRLYVAHTANDTVDVVDTRAGRYIHSIQGLKGVAGALVCEGQDLIFTSNRGENTVGIISASAAGPVHKVTVGIRPNGLAYDPGRRLLLCANVGDPAVPGSPSVTLVDVAERRVSASLPMPGRTRWAMYDPGREVFFVNIADPAVIAVVGARAPARTESQLDVPATGPHGLALDLGRDRVYCACDSGELVSLDASSGRSVGVLGLSGPPDVIFLNERLGRLYVAVGDPGVIDVVDVAEWRRIETVVSGPGAHTLALDEGTGRVYVFLPDSHAAAVFQDD